MVNRNESCYYYWTCGWVQLSLLLLCNRFPPTNHMRSFFLFTPPTHSKLNFQPAHWFVHPAHFPSLLVLFLRDLVKRKCLEWGICISGLSLVGKVIIICLANINNRVLLLWRFSIIYLQIWCKLWNRHQRVVLSHCSIILSPHQHSKLFKRYLIRYAHSCTSIHWTTSQQISIKSNYRFEILSSIVTFAYTGCFNVKFVWCKYTRMRRSKD